MKLNYSYQELTSLLAVEIKNHSAVIQSIEYDSRRIINGENVLFFALKGAFRNGHDFIDDAYSKGVRHFVVSKKSATAKFKDAHEIVVEDALIALEKLATYHRKKFNYSVVAITGSNGKTTVKEWLGQLLSGSKNVARSPKSYNSVLGVALSLLEMKPQTEIAIIEAGIGEKGTMLRKMKMIQPTHGIFTSFGKAHSELFSSKEEHFEEKMSLFQDVECFFYPENAIPTCKNGKAVAENNYSDLLKNFSLKDSASRQNARLAIAMCKEFGLSDDEIKDRIADLSPLALRLESFDGINGNTILNDTYNLDLDSLEHSLSYQLANCNGKKRVLVLGLHEKNEARELAIKRVVAQFEPISLHFQFPNKKVKIDEQNSSILIKGTRSAKMEILAHQLKQQNHQTFLEIDLKAIRHNINYYKSKIDDSTQLLCMVKASSYGSDAKTMGLFLEQIGVDYLGVAYVNEGVELRSKGVKLPILVMNCEENAFSECVDNQLEPAIYSLRQLNSFITELIGCGKTNYPIHLKLETGMKRLGFEESQLPELIGIIKGQPEIRVQSVYSHLAESDLIDSQFTKEQIARFENVSSQIKEELPYKLMRHILNSDGIINYASAQFDLVRLGIGMYGVTENENLRQAIAWKSTVSQLKEIRKGESVGYGRAFVAEKDMTIAVIPVGYADGFRRSLSHGVGGVYIGNQFCPVVGNVCMDMIMVDVTELGQIKTLEARINSVEIIGEHQTVAYLASKMNTISYEVMTSFSSRLHRIYLG
ncbi:MAG: alanine racemase [Fluviicola sp.]|nr:alanine racemase [Fluviicola sp.]PHQ99923.1 MAG: alanine racemase [Marinosulfonomonas sp.]